MVSFRIQSVLVHIFLSRISSLVFGIPELIHSFENVTGKISFRQMDGNSTYLRDSGELASYIPTLVSFELSNLRLRSATFIYTWDMGNGQVLEGPEPFVQCCYTSPGNYIFKLSIGANTAKHSTITGLYSVDLTVLDAIKSIQLRGSLNYNVDQSSSLSFQVRGSLPVWLCWRVLPDCHSPSPTSCNLVKIYKNKFNLNYTFTSVGTYCLGLSMRNDISNFQTSYYIYVQSSPVSHLIFILPSAVVIFASLVFIFVSVCRPRQESLMFKAVVENINCLPFTDIEMHANDAIIPCKPIASSSSYSNEAQPLLH
ncbi:transmembrane protein 130-like isoform X2 [Myxocyprinus asiaticus]|uniref:transmembrane protein 130-like isoform X2 n=1 Tax=Myxocyprinus asiaticus TaxID=70543 RepID=UPI00222334B9|nr:transmembrane protein 130-like isoform X2 [Myxocyprinus asiaticus]